MFDPESRFNSYVLAPLLLLIVANILFLDAILFAGRRQEAAQIDVGSTNESDACSSACSTAGEKEEVKPTLTPSLLATNTPTPSASVLRLAQPKEFYVPLGSGSTKSSEWEGLVGVEAYIDTSLYPSIKEVTFEAFLKIPTANGQVMAKLYNVTDKHDVWFSELTAEGNTSSYRSATVTLEKGNKLYRVMAKSTLKYEALVDNARLRIITN